MASPPSPRFIIFKVLVKVIDMFDAKTQQVDLTLLEGRLAACPPGGLQGIIVALSFGEVNTV
jgi:hypothetical protein